MASLVLSKSAEKDFARLPKPEIKKILRKLKALREDPFLGKQLGGEIKGLRSLRSWPYRIIYGLNKSGQILVFQIIHRQGAYK